MVPHTDFSASLKLLNHTVVCIRLVLCHGNTSVKSVFMSFNLCVYVHVHNKSVSIVDVWRSYPAYINTHTHTLQFPFSNI